ncbi:hypothetical protein ACQCSX_04550 [Pseudarthrobacter sp. P1]|uniref:hypothetical protein n=1 Tax=Pseudarthrobacter sp. P1 TaxID=3418418 RepID=UPI003CF05BF6
MDAITHGHSNRAVAQAADIAPNTLNRQLSGESDLKVQTVVDICRAYRAPILPALVAAGFITTAELATEIGPGALRDATDNQLTQEVLRRLKDAKTP